MEEDRDPSSLRPRGPSSCSLSADRWCPSRAYYLGNPLRPLPLMIIVVDVGRTPVSDAEKGCLGMLQNLMGWIHAFYQHMMTRTLCVAVRRSVLQVR
jgi:hypothetical protein